MGALLNAIVYSPAGQPYDLGQAREALAHARRRGYTQVTFQRDWETIDAALRGGQAHVVLFAGDRAMIGADSAAQTQRLGPAPLTTERVRQIVEHGATPPAGISPETIEAARRIARMVGRNPGRPSRYVRPRGVPKGVLHSDE